MAAVIPSITKLSARIIRVLGCNPSPMTLQGTNTYVVGTGKRRILIDTGDAHVPQYLNHLKSVLKNEGITLSHIFITHWHHDHIGGLHEVLELQENAEYCQVWKHPREEGDLLPNKVKFHLFKDAQEFSVEGATVRILHTPGHTTDHVILHLLEENAVFSGDCILGEGTAVFENLYDYLNSLENILDLHPAIIYPGHGNVIHNPDERIRFYIDHRKQREHQIMEALEQEPGRPFTEMDIVETIYKDTPEKMWKACAYNVNHHLVKLLKEQRVRQTEDGMWMFK